MFKMKISSRHGGQRPRARMEGGAVASYFLANPWKSTQLVSSRQQDRCSRVIRVQTQVKQPVKRHLPLRAEHDRGTVEGWSVGKGRRLPPWGFKPRGTGWAQGRGADPVSDKGGGIFLGGHWRWFEVRPSPRGFLPAAGGRGVSRWCPPLRVKTR
jgi:hypothetical protein